jgi:hypothetical protein
MLLVGFKRLIRFCKPCITRGTKVEGQKRNFDSPISVGKCTKYLREGLKSCRKKLNLKEICVCIHYIRVHIQINANSSHFVYEFVDSTLQSIKICCPVFFSISDTPNLKKLELSILLNQSRNENN